jgi:hypothetical protein
VFSGTLSYESIDSRAIRQKNQVDCPWIILFALTVCFIELEASTEEVLRVAHSEN